MGLHRLLPQRKALAAHLCVKIRAVAGGVLPVFRKVQPGKMRRAASLKARGGRIEPGVVHNAVAGCVVLVHGLGMVGQDHIRLYRADHVAHRKAGRVIVGQKAVRVVQHMGLAPQLLCKGAGLGAFLLPVFRNVPPGGHALFSRRQRQGHNASPLQRTGGKGSAHRQLHIAHMGANGQNGFCHASRSFPCGAAHSSFTSTPKLRTCSKPALS